MLALRRAVALACPLGVRGVAFVAANSQAASARGLKKHEDEYLVSASGVKYPGTSETLEPARRFLGEFELPEETLRQCMVHKSFAHAKFSYNERLAALGHRLFRLQAFRAAAAQMETIDAAVAVNGKNFNISQNAVEVLTSTPLVSQICDKAGLEPALFYKSGQPQLGSRVKAKAINALVGALLLEKGEATAIKFVNKRLLAGEFSVFDLAAETNVHT